MIEAIQRRLREMCGEKSKDIRNGYRTELCQYLTIDQVLASGAKLFNDEMIALLTRGGPEAKKIEDAWITQELTTENVLARAQSVLPSVVEHCVNHQGISAFDDLNRIEAWLWLLNNTTGGVHDDALALYGELVSDRPNIQQMGAPYVHAFAVAFNLELPELAKSDVFVAMVKGERCPWCKEGRDMGCV